MFAPEGTDLLSPLETKVLETGTDGGRGIWAALYDAGFGPYGTPLDPLPELQRWGRLSG